MIESSDQAAIPASTGPVTAGRLLREARQAQGMHIAALATSIKVEPRKLELLETDRLDELPDPAFARALAQTMCRALKIDPASVMGLLPPLSQRRLETLGEGLNTPFRERPGQFVPSDASVLGRPAVWIPLLLLLAALAVWLVPSGLFERATSGVGTDARVRPAVAASSAPGLTAATSASTTGTALSDSGSGYGPVPAAIDAATASASAVTAVVSTSAVSTGSLSNVAVADSSPVATTALVQLRTRADSWVEVTDAAGKPLIARVVKSGEVVGIDGVLPFKVRIGNALGTDLSFRGQPVPLAAHTRDNVARLDLN